MISGGNRMQLICFNSLLIKSKIWRRSLKKRDTAIFRNFIKWIGRLNMKFLSKLRNITSYITRNVAYSRHEYIKHKTIKTKMFFCIWTCWHSSSIYQKRLGQNPGSIFTYYELEKIYKFIWSQCGRYIFFQPIQIFLLNLYRSTSFIEPC